MELKTIIYTTNRRKWVERDFSTIYDILKRARDVVVHPFTVKYKRLPRKVDTYTSKSGGVYIDWEWLKKHFPAEDHNAVCLHISSRERERIGLKHPKAGAKLGGVYHRDADGVFDFIVIADERTMSYDGMTSFVRIFIHELSHGFAHWRGVRDFTHLWDYVIKNIKGIYYLHDFGMWNKLKSQLEYLKLKVKELQGEVNLQEKQPDHFPEQAPPLPKLYEAAVASLGIDVSPRDIVPDELGCAESVSMVIRKLTPFPIITGTWTLWDKFRKDTRFEAIGEPELGAIIISPTAMGNGKIVGHVGICGKDGVVMSNTSATGIFEENYTIESWEERYMKLGGFPVYYYRLNI